MNTLETIKKIIEIKMGFKCPEEIESAHLVNDIGMDSLDIVELTILIEREFQIQIDDATASDINTVHDLYSFVKQRAFI